MEQVEQLRILVRIIDPALLTTEDRASLLDLIHRAFDAALGHPPT
jgi:DNA-binding protein YbaB